MGTGSETADRKAVGDELLAVLPRDGTPWYRKPHLIKLHFCVFSLMMFCTSFCDLSIAELCELLLMVGQDFEGFLDPVFWDVGSVGHFRAQVAEQGPVDCDQVLQRSVRGIRLPPERYAQAFARRTILIHQI